MSRKDLVEKLINEGFSEKTLVTFTDKKLNMLASKVLNEAQTVTSTKTVYDSKNPKDIEALNTALKDPDALKNQSAEVKEDDEEDNEDAD